MSLFDNASKKEKEKQIAKSIGPTKEQKNETNVLEKRLKENSKKADSIDKEHKKNEKGKTDLLREYEFLSDNGKLTNTDKLLLKIDLQSIKNEETLYDLTESAKKTSEQSLKSKIAEVVQNDPIERVKELGTSAQDFMKEKAHDVGVFMGASQTIFSLLASRLKDWLNKNPDPVITKDDNLFSKVPKYITKGARGIISTLFKIFGGDQDSSNKESLEIQKELPQNVQTKIQQAKTPLNESVNTEPNSKEKTEDNSKTESVSNVREYNNNLDKINACRQAVRTYYTKNKSKLKKVLKKLGFSGRNSENYTFEDYNNNNVMVIDEKTGKIKLSDKCQKKYKSLNKDDKDTFNGYLKELQDLHNISSSTAKDGLSITQDMIKDKDLLGGDITKFIANSINNPKETKEKTQEFENWLSDDTNNEDKQYLRQLIHVNPTLNRVLGSNGSNRQRNFDLLNPKIKQYNINGSDKTEIVFNNSDTYNIEPVVENNYEINRSKSREKPMSKSNNIEIQNVENHDTQPLSNNESSTNTNTTNENNSSTKTISSSNDKVVDISFNKMNNYKHVVIPVSSETIKDDNWYITPTDLNSDRQ